MFAGDYTWEMNFTGSTWLRPATVQDQIRIQGRANVTVTLGSDWTPRGTTNWVSGVAQDVVHLTPITGNNSSIVIQLEQPSDLPPGPDGSPAPPIIIRLADGWINQTTGEYNYTFTVPADLPSSVYMLRFVLNFANGETPPGP